MDEVRLWQRVRTQEEIQADMNRQLGGNETGLMGYWQFEGEGATDFSRLKNHGQRVGDPFKTVASPLPAYAVFAGVNQQFVQTNEVFSGGNWTHLAAAFNQSYGLEFDGTGGYLDCGKDITLDISRDLTVEIFLQVKDQSRGNGLLSRGWFTDNTTDQDVPYAVYLTPKGYIRFAFEDVDHNIQVMKWDVANDEYLWFQSDRPIDTQFHKIAITRKRKETKTEKFADDEKTVIGVKVNAWDEIQFYIDGEKSGFHQYESRQDSTDDFRQPVEVGSSNQPLEIGLGFTATATMKERHASTTWTRDVSLSAAPFRGIMTEVRIWNVAREAEAIGRTIKGSEKGLVSWWQFEENDGSTAFDSKSRNHADIKGGLKWVKDPSPEGSKLTLYRNGSRVKAPRVKATALQAIAPQFTLGALQANGTQTQFFQGEMEELRIWKIIRTEEEIQDNLFRRLMGRDDLIAYYTFDPALSSESSTGLMLDDQSFQGHHLTIIGASHILSTAPIAEDIPQVRSALAGVKTAFHDLIQSPPSIQEYGDLQYDALGNLVGVFKRCYSFIKDGQWQLVTGFKVGDLVTEWIGQMQTAPQLIGYIEGAPPVPSENLTGTGYVVGEFIDYTGATSVELTQAQSTTYTYSASKEKGFDMSVDLQVGVLIGADVDAGIGLVTKTIDVENVVGLHTNFETSLGWLEDASTGSGRTTHESTRMELRGIVENEHAIAYPEVGRRFVPDNMGMALVKSDTADIFALRLKHNNALISFQMRPNPDIPADRNIITFPINPRYIKQGTLDGKVGFEVDPDYPNALSYSPDSSYFKPIEAYALKEQINRQEAELETYYEQYAAGAKGRRQDGLYGGDKDLAGGRILDKLPHLHKRNLVNSYVWTAAGGLYAETQETMDVYQEKLGGSYAFKGMAGLYTDLKLGIGGVGVKLGIDAMFGGHLNLTVTKDRESQTSFELNVDLSKVGSHIYLRNEDGSLKMKHPDTAKDPKKAKPQLMPGRVDAYRFMTFYLEPDSDQFELFFNRVVDPIWLAESDEPSAVALREAQQNKNDAWRILHRATYVSRILPPLSAAAPSSLEKAMQTLEIDSNYELIKQLEPFVINKLTSYKDFTDAIREAIQLYLPELQPHTQSVIQYMSLYFGIADGQDLTLNDDQFGQASLRDRTLNQPPIVNAGADQIIGLEGTSISIDLEGSVIDDRLEQSEALFLTWEELAETPTVVFSDPHALKTRATFTKRGQYLLRLTANDGLSSASANVTIRVNQRPVISAGADQQVTPQWAAAAGKPPLVAQLMGTVIDYGLGSSDHKDVTVKWTKQSRSGDVTFENAKDLRTAATFTKSGNYLLKLTVDNGTFTVEDEVTVAVAARSTDQLQALYTFETGGGAVNAAIPAAIPDVSGVGSPLDLEVRGSSASLVPGGLALTAPMLLETQSAATKITRAVKLTHEITVEAWIKPQANATGLARIITLSEGPGQRSFTLGQTGDRYYVGLRTTTTDANASSKALTAGQVDTTKLTHVVFTRNSSGLLRFFQDGQEVGRRQVSGSFSEWQDGFQLALGNELGAAGERAWLGEFHLAAIYSRALTADEVRQNYEFGANANLPPVVFAGSDQVINWAQAAPIVAQLAGSTTHDRLSPNATTTWSQIAGPGSPNGVTVSQAELTTAAEFAGNGRYVMRLTVDDGELMSSDEVAIVVNQPPTVKLQVRSHVALSEAIATTALKGIIENDGLGEPANLVTTWSQISGPNTLRIDGADQLEAIATFTERGIYELALKVDNGRLATTVPVTITVNQSPAVSIDAVPVLTLPLLSEVSHDVAAVKVQSALVSQLTDSGLAHAQQDHLNFKWEQVSGPGTVQFDNATQPNTQATFTTGGIYGLRLTVTNGDTSTLSNRAELSVTVNHRPSITIGAVQDITLPAVLELDAAVSDDGLPTVPGAVDLTWTQVSGSGNVTFSSPKSSYTTVSFSQADRYVLRLTAHDGAAQTVRDVAIEVKAPPRVTQELALYTFKEAGGAIVNDLSSTAPFLNLTLNPTAARLEGGVLSLTQPTLIAADAPATKIISSVKQARAMTFETWIKPRDITLAQDPAWPARIATISLDHEQGNFLLGQETGGRYVARLRTKVTPGDRNGTMNALSAGTVSTTQVSHLVYTWDERSRTANLYLNGVNVGSKANIEGDFTAWGDDFKLALGNEFNQPRAWLGEYHLVAVYDRALSPAEVEQNFYAGLQAK